MASHPQRFCRCGESKRHSSTLQSERGHSYTKCIRYNILACASDLNDAYNDHPMGNIGILELSGDVPQLISDQRSIESNQTKSKKDIDEIKRNSKRHQSTVLSALNIERCFDRNIKRQLSRSSTIETYTDVASTWGRLTSSIPLFEGGCEPSSARRDGHIALTIGNHVINGKHTYVESGNSIVVLKKVPKHCSCACSAVDEHKCEETHESYFEVCAVTSAKVLFTERPSIIQESETRENEIMWSLFQSQNMEELNPNWLLLNVPPLMLDEIHSEKAYFKLIQNTTERGVSRLVLTLNDETFYLERVEVGGKLVLVTPMDMGPDKTETANILSIIGCCKFAHNLVKATPNFKGLSKTGELSLGNFLDSLPVADEQIKLFLMNTFQEWPCYYLCLQGTQFVYLECTSWAEFAIKFVSILPIYFNQKPSCKKHVQDLTMQDMWNVMEAFPHVLDCLPERLRTLPVIFQILRAMCDLKQPFIEFEDYMEALGNETRLLDANMILNLFKIHRMVVLAIGSANEGTKMTYDAMVKRIDSLVFSDMVPSYIFDEMIQYLINNIKGSDEDYEDYLNCLRFYYANSSFSDVTTRLAHQFRNKSQGSTDKIQYDLTGVQLFVVAADTDGNIMEELKVPCFNYDIFKLNTKGLTKLRFNYAMNSLLALCRSPVSLHLAFVADKMVATMDRDQCIIRMYPKEKEDSIRDSLSSLFKLSKNWHLEVIDKKLARFWGAKLALESITGPPNFHTRLWITTEKNNFNYVNLSRYDDDSTNNDMSKSRKDKEGGLYPIEEESYIIVNSNVPL